MLKVAFNDERKYGFSKSERILEIKNKVANSSKTAQIEYQGRIQDLKVIRVNIGLPIYRIENFRTATLQKEYLAKHSDTIDNNFFKVDPESIDVQIVQHELLKGLIKESGLLDSFEKGLQKGQTLPLIVTDEGIVVNGNRRLCCWRELYNRPSQTKYSSFETVEVAVLPDHDPNSVIDLEMNLQVKKDLKADYSWHARAVSFKSELARGHQASEIEKKYELENGSVQKAIDCYQLAEKYLESIGKKDCWSEVDKDEFAFEQMLNQSKRRENEDDPFGGKLYEKLCFDVISANRNGKLPEGSGRVWDIIKDIGKYLPKITEHLKSEVVPDEYQRQVQDWANESGGVPDNVIVLNALKNSDPVCIARAVVRKAKVEKEIDRESRGKTFIRTQVRKSLDALGSCVTADKSGQTTEGIANMLDTIEYNVRALREWLKNDADTN